jgi:cytochrome c biogenesis protein
MEFKSDPGVPLVYAGFGGMCITTVLSYLSHSQVWGMQKGSSVFIGGKSNRASVAFDVEMEDTIQKMPEI